MLKNLPIIPSQTFQKFTHYSHHLLFLYYSFNYTESIIIISKMHTYKPIMKLIKLLMSNEQRIYYFFND